MTEETKAARSPGGERQRSTLSGKWSISTNNAVAYVGYSVTLDAEQRNQHRAFPAGTRLCVMQAERGRLRLVEYAGCGPTGELKWIDPADVTIWRPKIGRRYVYVPEEEPCVITAVEVRGPGWHCARMRGDWYTVHDQELRDAM